MLVLPKASDVRAARGCLNWTQSKLSFKCDTSLSTISGYEAEKTEPKLETLEILAKVFFEEGIIFHPEGGFIRDVQTIKIFDGVEGFLKVLEDATQDCSIDKKEILFLGNDDKRSSEKINEMHKSLYKKGIPYRLLIAQDNDFILGPLEDYRKIEDDFFLSEDVIIIYGDKVSFCVDVEGDLKNYKINNRRHLVIKDKGLSSTFKKCFERLWKKGKKPTKSETKQIFFKNEPTK